ncbi:MAG: hypothetical protein KU37_09670 [Sulfuricurvum sp. PC08-66]|nr:MAG: hypothetical protein KU37_09670 [Sulfuricurvum sp. PC08-66]
MQKLLYTLLVAALFLGGCEPAKTPDSLPEGKVLLFYDATTGSQLALETNGSIETSMDSNSSAANYMKDKSAGYYIYWYDTNSSEDTYFMVKNDYNYSSDGNLTHSYFHYFEHHNTPASFHPHAANDFNFSRTDINESIKESRGARLERFNTYMAEQNATRQELIEALNDKNITSSLCNFFVPSHEHNDTNTTHATPHYVLTHDAQLHIFRESDGNLSFTTTLVLDGATSCEHNTSAITAMGEEGVLVFMHSSQKIYGVDAHDGGTPHVHSTWRIGDVLKGGFVPTHIVGLGAGETDHTGHVH